MLSGTDLKIKLKSAIVYSILGFLILVGWAVGSPPGSSPDEDIHLSSAWCYAKYQGANCESIPLRIVEIGKCYFLDSGTNSNCEKKISIIEVPPERFYSGNNYYNFLSNFVYLDNIDKSIVLLRITNSLLSCLAIFFVVLLTSRVVYIPFLICWLVVNIPLGFFILSSVNPSSWLYIFSLIFLPITYSIFTKPISLTLSMIKIVAIGTTFFLAYEARYETLMFAAVFSAASIPILFIPKIKNQIIRSTLYIFTFLVTARLAVMIWGYSKLVDYRDFEISKWEILTNLPSIITGVFGGWGLGSLETTMPPVTYIGSFVTVISIIFFALRFVNGAEAISLFLLTTFMVLIPFFVLVQSKLRVGEWLQPRYILPIFYVIVGLSLIVIFKSINVASLGVVVNILSLFSSLAFIFGLHTLYRRYTVGLDQFNLFFHDNNSWWWNQSLYTRPVLFYLIAVTAYLIFWVLIRKEVLSNEMIRSKSNSY